MPAKYKVLIDGTDYPQDVKNWNDFLPSIMRSKIYKSHISTFSEKKLLFAKEAKTYLADQKNTHGAFAASTFVIQSYSRASESYIDVVSGNISYKSLKDNIITGYVEADFIPDNQADSILNRDEVVMNLAELKDLDGNAIDAFVNETHTIDLDQQTIDGFTSASTTTAEVMLSWEFFLRIAQKLLGKDDALRSTILGRTDGEVFTYESNGELSLLAFTSGFGIRGGAISTYGIKTSLREAFEALNSQTPIGLGIEYSGGAPFLVIEEIDYFYDNSETALIISSPEEYESGVDESKVYGKVFTGFRNYDKAGVDGFILSMHTERSYVTGLDSISTTEYNVRTNYIASGYVIEPLRKLQLTANGESSDWDEFIFMIQLRRDGMGGFTREKDEDLTDSNNVLYPATQYNLRLTPSRTFNNHLKVLNAAMKLEYDYKEDNDDPFTGWSPIRFVSGAGNVEGETQIDPEADLVIENEDKSAGQEPIFIAEKAAVKTQISEDDYMDLIAGLKKKVTVSYDGTDTEYFIDEVKLKSINEIELTLQLVNQNY